jgi:hypothetical protein
VGQVPSDAQVQPGMWPLPGTSEAKNKKTHPTNNFPVNPEDYPYSKHMLGVVREIRRHTTRHIRFRPHPKSTWYVGVDTLDAALAGFPHCRMNTAPLDLVTWEPSSTQ